MTLKLLNTGYLKLIRKILLFGAILLLAAVSLLSPTGWCAEIVGYNRHLAEADNSTPTSHDAAAIAYLEEHKRYDSLRAALNATRTQQGKQSFVTTPALNEQKLIASDGAQPDIFGDKVAASGLTVVVGARADDNLQGAAYVFERLGGSWVEMQKLTASDGAAGDQFSDSISISGSTLVVGAPVKDIGGIRAKGAAYVFERQGATWVETQKLTASDGSVFAFFGKSVAVSGSTIVAGAVNKGAYVFNRQGGSWVQTQKLTASDAATNNNFGLSVAISGSTIVVGASFDDIDGTINQGSAYVFERKGGTWVETQKLTASDGAESDAFGRPVVISGSTLVVGASEDSIGGNFFQGSAYVFERRGEGWVEMQKLTASDGAAADQFANSVAVSGATIIAGSPNNDIGRGAAYVFNRSGGRWVATQKLTASDAKIVDHFGSSVAVSGSAIVVGAPFVDIGGNIAQGAAYVFEP